MNLVDAVCVLLFVGGRSRVERCKDVIVRCKCMDKGVALNDTSNHYHWYVWCIHPNFILMSC